MNVQLAAFEYIFMQVSESEGPTDIRAHTHTHTHTQEYSRRHTHTHTEEYSRRHTYTHTHTQSLPSLSLSLCVCVCVNIHIFVCIILFIFWYSNPFTFNVVLFEEFYELNKQCDFVYFNLFKYQRFSYCNRKYIH